MSESQSGSGRKYSAGRQQDNSSQRNVSQRQSGLGSSNKQGTSKGQGARRNQSDAGSHRSRQNEPAPRIRISPARLVAYDVLRDVDERDAYANLALPSRIREAKLDRRDAALATELAAGVLRGRGRYDRIIELAADRPIHEIDPRTRNVLRLGVHQLLSMRTATHAAVNESVELQRKVGNASAAGFVNGVLRSVTREDPQSWDAQIVAAAERPDDALAALTSHPAWIVRALRAALVVEGRESELDDLLTADNTSPKVSLVVLPGEAINGGDLAGLEEEAGITESGPSPIGFELAGGLPSEAIEAMALPVGMARVQDQGSQLAALVLTHASEIEPGERWLDLCAGPGGKTAVLGAEARMLGATLRANEVSEHRADLVRDSVSAVAEVIDVVSFDGRADEAFGGETAEFDRILVDAPCSGLGALRRRPEARWRKKPADLPELTALQTELLESAIAHLKQGGLLAYVTCSPHLAETRVTVDGVLKKHPEMREMDAKTVLQSISRDPLDLAGTQLSAQLWPHRNGTDAMFISLLTKA